jgi:hypothetical protein
VAPTDQRLHGDHSTALQIHLGLIKQFKLVALQRPAQIRIERQQFVAPRIHVGSKEAVLIAPSRLGPVHGGVGIAE